uniref:Uncharacterized protein n=1 Tax=Anguilla anguilla TaxID=7936 RepID=A0A0E9R6N0_ANGAN
MPALLTLLFFTRSVNKASISFFSPLLPINSFPLPAKPL